MSRPGIKNKVYTETNLRFPSDVVLACHLLGFRKYQLAEALGISVKTLWRICNKGRYMRRPQRKLLATFLNSTSPP